MVRTALSLLRAWVQSLVRELGSRELRDVEKKKRLEFGEEVWIGDFKSQHLYNHETE